jgi:hypothetical protein
MAGGVRILLVSDLHYRLRQFDWLLAAAGHVDAVAIVRGRRRLGKPDRVDHLGPVPAHVDVDLDAGVAVWTAATDWAEVSLW